MTEILLLATIVLGAILYDTRRRLIWLEGRVRDDAPPHLSGQLANPGPAERVAEEEPAPPLDPRREIAPAADADVSLLSAAPLPPAFAMAAVAASIPELPAEPVHSAPENAHDIPIAAQQGAGFSFEDLFGRKLPIWAGGITLIVAAALMVKYSIDSGLLSPAVRIVLGMLFGAGLIGGADVARRCRARVRDPRVAQSLAGAGIGALYVAVLSAANLYDLIGQGTAFAGLCTVTGLAMVLALRFGVPCAVLGLVGGLATPAVVQSSAPSVPLLAGYLAVVIGSLTLLSRRQRWVWLGVSALVGGAGWSLMLIVLGGLDSVSTLSLGLLMLLLGLGLPALAFDRHAAPLLHVAAAVVAALQLALLVGTGDFAPLTWGLYGLLSLAFVWLADSRTIMHKVVPVPMLTALCLAALWPSPGGVLFAGVIAGIAVIYGGYALHHLWRGQGGLVEVGLLGAIALGGYAVAFGHFYTGTPGQDLWFAMLALLFTVLPALGAVLGWKKPARADDARFALLASSAGLMVVLSALIGLPEWTAPISIAFVGVVLLMLATLAKDHRLSLGAVLFQASAILALPVIDGGTTELNRFLEAVVLPHPLQALLRWGAVASAATMFAWRRADTRSALLLQPVTAVLGYGFVAQFVAAPWLAIVGAVAVAVCAEASRRRPALRLAPGAITLIAMISLWAVEPVGQWMRSGLMSVFGNPVFSIDLPMPGLTAQRLLIPALLCLMALWRAGEVVPEVVRKRGAGLTGCLMLIGVHIFYKQLFMINELADFQRLGLAERTLWEIALVGGGLAVSKFARNGTVGLALIGAGVAHNLLYTVLLHNPLWDGQAVGPWPLANLLLPAFGIGFAAPLILTYLIPAAAVWAKRLADLLRMATILLFAFATLRQLFCGTMLNSSGVGEVENICSSVLAITLALGFLLWGIRKGLRDWRIASLVLMLVAVVKVFLFDASGLEGLLRIASFLALGFSLIGIGWLFSRNLKG